MKRNEILATLPKCVPVATETWGKVYVRQIKGSEFERFMDILDSSTGSERLARLTVLGLCNADGERILEDGDEPVVVDGPMEPMGEVAAAFLELNGVSEEQKKSSDPPSTSPTGYASSSAISTPPPLSKRFQSVP